MSEAQLLLMVEDDLGLQKQFKWSFSDYELVFAGDRLSAIAAVKTYAPKVVTLDLGLPPDPANASEGLATLQAILVHAPQTKVIVVTGNDTREHAIRAIALGAYDFYQKPVDPDVLGLIIARAFKLRILEQDYAALQHQQTPLQGIIAGSASMQALIRNLEKIAPTQASVMLLGESGTGKEVLAKAIHQLSARREQPFVAVNCAAIPETLLESELFGYEKGAYTGAATQTLGKIETANGGTFFLDEIGDLPYALQAKLLRFIQERVIERLGGRKSISVDVRIICATHQNLSERIDQNLFRSDLFYRLGEIQIDIPPLRAREGDVLTIANTLLRRYCLENKKKPKLFTLEAALAIETYAWPGNIRELENKIKRAVILLEQPLLTPDDLELETPSALLKGANVNDFNLKAIRETAEKTAILRAINHADQSMTEAAKLLGISRPTLYGLLEKYQISFK